MKEEMNNHASSSSVKQALTFDDIGISNDANKRSQEIADIRRTKKTLFGNNMNDPTKDLETLKKQYGEEKSFFKRVKLKQQIEMIEGGFNSFEEYTKFKSDEYEKNNKLKMEQLESQKKEKEMNRQMKIAEEQKKFQKDYESSNESQRKQFDIIRKFNPMLDSYHVGIRNPKEIKTFEETLKDEESFNWGDFSRDEALKTLKEGKITIYSSKPISQGGFVSTSKSQAEQYAGGKGNKIYSSVVPHSKVAWINGDEGQYADLEGEKYGS